MRLLTSLRTPLLLSLLAAAPLAACGDDASDNPGGGGPDGGGGGDADAGIGPDAAPLPIPEGLSKVATGEYQVFYMVDGDVLAYGASVRALGVGTTASFAIPPVRIDVPEGLKFVDVQSGLHQSLAADENGHVWTWGDTNEGRQGSGIESGADATVPYMIEVDADGAAFDGVIKVYGTTNFNAALKSDGTVWIWGNTERGVLGDGTDGGIVTRPTRIDIPLPKGVKITKLAPANIMVALASDGSVWSWGQGETKADRGTNSDEYRVPQKITTLPANIVDIAVGAGKYALTSDGVLWGWGQRGAFLGVPGPAPGNYYAPTPVPIDLTDVLDLPLPIAKVASSSLTTHVILTDGSLWGWGDAATGTVGHGEELDYSMTEAPYAWSFEAYQLMVMEPVRIAPSVSNFTEIFTNAAYCFYVYAQTADGRLYSWGRNKTAVLGNGVYGRAANGNPGTSSNMVATYPNSWDVPLATEVSPLTVEPMPMNSPYCVENPNAPDCF